MHKLVKIKRDPEGDEIPKEERKWCLLVDFGGGNGPMCTRDHIGLSAENGESSAEVVFKNVQRGGITCKDCLDELIFFKNVKL